MIKPEIGSEALPKEARAVADRPRTVTTPCVAILRVDEFQDTGVAIENRVTVTRVLLDEAAAKTEVTRLNELNRGKGCRYYSQVTKLVPSDV